jgi:hypothetical protein
VRAVLLSGRDKIFWAGIGLKVSVGDTLLTSTPCKFTSNTGKNSTYSTTGLSAWLICDNLIGEYLFVTNPNIGIVMFYEIMAFTQYNILPFVSSVFGANSTDSSSINNLKKTEMNIQTGNVSSCFTSADATVSDCTGAMNDPCYPYIWFKFEAVIPFSAFLAIPQIP